MPDLVKTIPRPSPESTAPVVVKPPEKDFGSVGDLVSRFITKLPVKIPGRAVESFTLSQAKIKPISQANSGACRATRMTIVPTGILVERDPTDLNPNTPDGDKLLRFTIPMSNIDYFAPVDATVARPVVAAEPEKAKE